VILSAPNVERTDAQTTEIARLTLLHCLGDDTLKRRRYVLINYQNFSFILGGYDFDVTTKIRSQPLHDFVYDIVRIRLEEIKKQKNGLSSFRITKHVGLFRLFQHQVVLHLV
jgi:hypothetical protein